jgi:hypothetical protein
MADSSSHQGSRLLSMGEPCAAALGPQQEQQHTACECKHFTPGRGTQRRWRPQCCCQGACPGRRQISCTGTRGVRRCVVAPAVATASAATRPLPQGMPAHCMYSSMQLLTGQRRLPVQSASQKPNEWLCCGARHEKTQPLSSND